MKAVIIYTTEGGNTEAYSKFTADVIKKQGVDVEIKHVTEAKVDDLKNCDFYVLAEPTWGDGEHYDDWIPFDEAMQKADLSGTQGAVMSGCDRSYSQLGVAIDLIEDTMTKAGAKILQRGIKIELEPTPKTYEYIEKTWAPDLVKRAKGELEIQPNTPRMTLAEVCAMMGKPAPEEDDDLAAADAGAAAMPPRKAAKVLPPPADPVAPARAFERRLTTSQKLRRQTAQGVTFASLGIVTGFVHYFFFAGGINNNGTLFEPPQSFKIGSPDDYSAGVDTRWLTANNIWVVKEPTQLYVIIAICTHLGCTPDWKDNENKYKCPCHGSGYYMDGTNFEGPAPRPMEHAKVSIDPADGQIVVDKAVVFRGELEQWGADGAYIPL